MEMATKTLATLSSEVVKSQSDTVDLVYEGLQDVFGPNWPYGMGSLLYAFLKDILFSSRRNYFGS